MILQRFVHFTAKALQPKTKIGPKCRYSKENADNPSADTAKALQLYQSADITPPHPLFSFFYSPHLIFFFFFGGGGGKGKKTLL